LGYKLRTSSPFQYEINYSHIPCPLIEFVLCEEMPRDAAISVYNVLVWKLGDEGKRAEVAYKWVAFDIVVSQITGRHIEVIPPQCTLLIALSAGLSTWREIGLWLLGSGFA
jgi:hypothetical protein